MPPIGCDYRRHFLDRAASKRAYRSKKLTPIRESTPKQFVPWSAGINLQQPEWQISEGARRELALPCQRRVGV